MVDKISDQLTKCSDEESHAPVKAMSANVTSLGLFFPYNFFVAVQFGQHPPVEHPFFSKQRHQRDNLFG